MGGDGSDAVVVERLLGGDVSRARAALAMMHEVLDDDPVALSDGYLGGVLANDACWVIAAFEGDEPVGCITGHELAMTRHERTELFVYDLAVRADRQRRGIGRRLVDALVAGAAAQGVGVVFVLADDEDVDAIAFYEGLGGRPAPVTMFDLGTD